MTMPTDATLIAQTRCWVESVIVALNFCPFAGREVARDTIHYQVSHAPDLESALLDLISACEYLDQNPATETSLLIFADAFSDFDDYLDMLALANDLLAEQGYEGIYQLASFHPDYCFEGEAPVDAANYTNRSPYPMLHLIREASLEKVLASYPEPEAIPQRNIEVARQQGADALQDRLKQCMQIKDDQSARDD